VHFCTQFKTMGMSAPARITHRCRDLGAAAYLIASSPSQLGIWSDVNVRLG
jgi:hypothetical protein